MNRIVVIVWGLLMAFAAQAMDERLERINAIKKNADYLYGEATMATQERATSLAYELLQKEVLGWARRDSQELVISSATDINRMAESITVRRAEMYRVFVFVKKSGLLCKKNQGKHPKDSVREHAKDSLITDEVKRTIKQRLLGRRQNDALYRLKKARNFFELKEIMLTLKENGDVTAYGKYATAEHPSECYLIVYDPAGNIRALLGKGEETRPNLKTGRDDSVRNYRGCGAIWFLLNEE